MNTALIKALEAGVSDLRSGIPFTVSAKTTRIIIGCVFSWPPKGNICLQPCPRSCPMDSFRIPDWW